MTHGPPSAARSLSVPGQGAAATFLLTILSALVMLVACLAGGGQGGIGDLVAQELALVLLAVVAWHAMRGSADWRAPVWVRVLPIVAVALPLLQLLPVPEALWSMGPARRELASQLREAGVAPMRVLSLDPLATEAALWSLIPAIALFLATLSLRGRARKLLLGLVVVLAIANVFLGMAQMADASGNDYRLYSRTNLDQAVGFFANRNHMASMLVMIMPLVLVWTGAALVGRLGGRGLNPLLIVAGCAVVILLVVGIALTRSRAGLLLGILAVLGSLPLVLSLGKQRGVKRGLAITLGIAVMLTVQFSLVGALERAQTSWTEDGRVKYSLVTLQAARAYLPWGSGLGTFRPAYQPFEARHEPGRYIVNHAHNDYAELFLEGGIPALALMAGFVTLWLRQGFHLWRTRSLRPESGSALLVRACWLAATLGLLHSAMDYPLRTTANMSVFAVLVAIAFSEVRSHRARQTGDPSAKQRIPDLPPAAPSNTTAT